MKKMAQNNKYALDLMIWPNDKMEEFNNFMAQYGNAPDKYLFREIARVKNEVSQEILQQHIKNLDAMAQMEGFVTNEHKRRIQTVKRILSTEPSGFKARNEGKHEVASQFWAGSSLLLWFLILAAIWRRRFFWRGYPYY